MTGQTERGQLLNTEQMAALLDMSPQRLRELARRGSVPKAGHGRFDLGAVVPAYCRMLREEAAGRAAAGEGLDLTAERAKLARAQREATELATAAKRRELVPAQEAEAAGAALASIVISGLNNLPDRLADGLAGMTDAHQVHRAMQAEIDHLIQSIRAAHWDPQQDRTPSTEHESEAA